MTKGSSSDTGIDKATEDVILREAKGLADNYFSRRQILKNVVLLGFAFLMVTTPIIGLGRLQSSLHRVDGLGVIASSILYGSLIISSMFLPKLLIGGIGHKWTTIVCYIGYILWIPANGHAIWATMIPASIIVGLCSAPLWASQLSYITIVAGQYSKLSHEIQDAVITRFMGIFFMFFQFGICLLTYYYHYYNCFTAPWTLSGTIRVSRYWYQNGKTSKVKPIWIYWSKR